MAPGPSHLVRKDTGCLFRRSYEHSQTCKTTYICRGLRRRTGANSAEIGHQKHSLSLCLVVDVAQPACAQTGNSGFSSVVQTAAVTFLGIAWLLGRPGPAAADLLPRSSNQSRVETVVSTPSPTASVAASVTKPNDSMLLIVGVCLGFWMLSATISAIIAAVMNLSGRSLSSGTRAAGGWTSAGILDTFDIMRLPLAYEVEEPTLSGRREVIYKPWDGPNSSYIPVNMVKVLDPGLREAGLVVRTTWLQHDNDLSIISITSSGENNVVEGALLDSNGCGTYGSNGHDNGSKKR